MIASALTQEATLVRRTPATPDDEGNPVTTSTSTTVACRLAQRSSDDRTDGDRRSTASVLYLLPEVELDGNDTVEVAGRSWEIEGEPYLASTPRGPHHWEVSLREVTP